MSRNLTTQLVDLAEHALRSWFGDDITREDAEKALPSWRFSGGLDSEMRDEIVARFPAAEPPSVPGRDWLPAAIIPAEAAPLVALAMAAGMQGRELTAEMLNAAKARLAPDAAVLVAEAVAVLDEPKPRQWRDRDGDIWVEQPWEGGSILAYTDLMGDVSRWTFEHVERECGPLVEVPAPVKELPAAEAPTGHAAGDHSNCCACVCPDGAL